MLLVNKGQFQKFWFNKIKPNALIGYVKNIINKNNNVAQLFKI